MNLQVPEGKWWDMNGSPGEGELLLQEIGPPLAAKRPGRVIVTGHLLEDGLPSRKWAVVQVATEHVGAEA